MLSQEVVDLANDAHPPLVWFCIEASAVADVDFTAAATLRSLHGILKEKGIRLIFADVFDETVRTELERYELIDLIGKDGFYSSLGELLRAYDKLPPMGEIKK
jgi:MFS superfamily sulfate permease-like transporter